MGRQPEQSLDQIANSLCLRLELASPCFLAKYRANLRELAQPGVDVALHFDRGNRALCGSTVDMVQRVVAVFPDLVVDMAYVLRNTDVFDQSVTIEVAILRDPLDREPGIRQQLAEQVLVPCPGDRLGKQPDPKWRRVDRAVIRRMRNLAESCHLAIPHFVQDLARLLLPPRVDLGPLQRRQHAQRADCPVRRQRQRLEAGDQAVAAEWGDVPRNTCRRKRTLRKGGLETLEILAAPQQ